MIAYPTWLLNSQRFSSCTLRHSLCAWHWTLWTQNLNRKFYLIHECWVFSFHFESLSEYFTHRLIFNFVLPVCFFHYSSLCDFSAAFTRTVNRSYNFLPTHAWPNEFNKLCISWQCWKVTYSGRQEQTTKINT